MLNRNSESDRDFDAFLFSVVGHYENETPVSVNSALALLDLYPYAVAKSLAWNPPQEAIARLTVLFGQLATPPLTLSDPEAKAVHLVALLPYRMRIGRNFHSALPHRDLWNSRPARQKWLLKSRW